MRPFDSRSFLVALSIRAIVVILIREVIMLKNQKLVLKASVFSMLLILIPMLVHASHDLYEELNDAVHTLNPSKVEQVLKNLKKPLDPIGQGELHEALYELCIRFAEDFDNAYKCIELLLEAGADPDMIIPVVTRYSFAIQRQRSECALDQTCNVINLLVSHGADPNKGKIGLGMVKILPLEYAICRLKEPKIVRCLFDAGADPYNLSNLINSLKDCKEGIYNIIKQKLKAELNLDIEDLPNQSDVILKKAFEVIGKYLWNARRGRTGPFMKQTCQL